MDLQLPTTIFDEDTWDATAIASSSWCPVAAGSGSELVIEMAPDLPGTLELYDWASSHREPNPVI